MITTVRQARNLLADPTLNVFENKQAYLICNCDRSKALGRMVISARGRAGCAGSPG
jgi:hypothetical protein